MGQPHGVAPFHPREELSNKQAEFVATLRLALRYAHGHYTIENPNASHFFMSSWRARFARDREARVVSFGQCACDLKVLGCSRREFCRKLTLVAGSFPEILRLARKFSSENTHACAIGSYKGQSRTAAAGRYPPKLRRERARAVQFLRTRCYRT
jgi:hypothetical protein